jgi:hypothetical protein
MENILSILLILSVITGIFFVFMNVYKQREAEKHLEILLAHDYDVILKELRYTQMISENLEKDKSNSTKRYINNELLLISLKSFIDKLNEDDRIVMQKSFGKKSDSDQQRYALKIFEESGVSKALHNSGLQLNHAY